MDRICFIEVDETTLPSLMHCVPFNLILIMYVCPYYLQDEKDQKIRDLTIELSNKRQRCKLRCAAYQEQISMLLKDIQEHSDHLSTRVQDIVRNIRELENEQCVDS